MNGDSFRDLARGLLVLHSAMLAASAAGSGPRLTVALHLATATEPHSIRGLAIASGASRDAVRGWLEACAADGLVRRTPRGWCLTAEGRARFRQFMLEMVGRLSPADWAAIDRACDAARALSPLGAALTDSAMLRARRKSPS